MFSVISDSLVNLGAKVLPASAVKGIATVERLIMDGEFKYFNKAAGKVDKLAAVAKEFVKFCQTYIYIPTLFVMPVIVLIFMFGNVQEKSNAKKKVIYIIAGIFALMSLTSLVSMVISAFIPENVTNKLASK